MSFYLVGTYPVSSHATFFYTNIINFGTIISQLIPIRNWYYHFSASLSIPSVNSGTFLHLLYKAYTKSNKD